MTLPGLRRYQIWQVTYGHDWKENYQQNDLDDLPAILLAAIDLQMIPWLHSLVHHLDATTFSKVEVMVISCGTCPTGPAELVFAKDASHVVAPSVFFDSGPAHWTKRDVSSVCVQPALELPTQRLLAGDKLSMPYIAALEAHLSLAPGTDKLLHIAAGRLDMSFAAWLWAKSDQWIRLEVLRCLESLVLGDKVCRQVLLEDCAVNGPLALELWTV